MSQEFLLARCKTEVVEVGVGGMSLTHKHTHKHIMHNLLTYIVYRHAYVCTCIYMCKVASVCKCVYARVHVYVYVYGYVYMCTVWFLSRDLAKRSAGPENRHLASKCFFREISAGYPESVMISLGFDHHRKICHGTL